MLRENAAATTLGDESDARRTIDEVALASQAELPAGNERDAAVREAAAIAKDDVPPRKYSNDGQISNDGFAMATDERRKKGYAYQRSCKNAGRLLGYSNFEFVDSDDCTRHRLLEERGDVPASRLRRPRG